MILVLFDIMYLFLFRMFGDLIVAVVKKYVHQWCIILIADNLHFYLFPTLFKSQTFRDKNKTVLLHYVVYNRRLYEN